MLVKIYQYCISPILPNACRFMPTCSEYMLESINKHGIIGVFSGVRRILRCHPWGDSGYDPVPKGKKRSAEK
jgi:uncharacterized protein